MAGVWEGPEEGAEDASQGRLGPRWKSGQSASYSEDDSNIILAVNQVHGALIAVEEQQGAIFHPRPTFRACTFNLAKVIMGAGMMAIPKAFYLLGWALGSALLLLIHVLTYLSLASLVDASAFTGIRSYSGLVRALLGHAAEVCLQLAVFLNCYLMNVVFMVVLGDILIGHPEASPGLIAELFPHAPALLLERSFVLGLLSLLVLLPLASMRSMEKLAAINIIGVLCNAFFAALCLVLALAAGQVGQLQPFDPWPRWAEMGSTPLLITLGLAAVAPVMLNCDVCHQSVHPLMPLLKPYTPRSMKGVIWWALSVCNALYAVIAVSSCLTFGLALHADVLANIGVDTMTPLFGLYPAHLVAGAVRVGYLLSLVGSYVLLCFPLRQCIGEVVLTGQQDVDKLWTLLTMGLVGTVYAIACFIPSIWGVLGFVGATASTIQAWVIPGLIMWTVSKQKLRMKAGGAPANWQQQVTVLGEPLLSQGLLRGAGYRSSGEEEAAWVLLTRCVVAVVVAGLGMLLFVNGFVHQALQYFSAATDGGGEEAVVMRLELPLVVGAYVGGAWA